MLETGRPIKTKSAPIIPNVKPVITGFIEKDSEPRIAVNPEQGCKEKHQDRLDGFTYPD
jgi:hypothetical protein